jgi:hypothetical protein
MKNTILIFLVSVLFPVIASGQSIIYVSEVAIGLNNGLSWADAFNDLQEAISAASEGNQIWVAKGIYKPSSNGQRNLSFNLKNGVSIYGGFNGDEIDFFEREIMDNPTILSGDIGEIGNRVDNSFHVIFAKGVDSTAILDGFLITSGYAKNALLSNNDLHGGGLLVEADEFIPVTAPTISNCSFSHCIAEYGGAVSCLGFDGNSEHVASPSFSNCTFLRNQATSGGAIHKDGHENPNFDFRIVNCSFNDNRASFLGGAINFANADPNVYLVDCKFERDTAVEGACLAFIFEQGGTFLDIKNSYFANNYANSRAGAILIANYGGTDITLNLSNVQFIQNIARYNQGGSIALTNQSDGAIFNVTINDCMFNKNKSFGPGAGIEMFFDAGNTKGFFNLNNTCFIENARFVQSSIGTALSMRWGSHLWDKEIEYKLKATNCLFIRNKSVYSALTPWESKVQADFINCTFYNNGIYPFNKAWRPSLNGIDSFNITRFTNCIIWESLQTELKNIFYNNNPDSYSVNDYYIDHSILSHPDCSFNNVSICGDAVHHGAWPEFIDTLGCSDFTFMPSSPAFNAGINSILDSLELSLDFAGNPRIYCDTVDLGAFETQLGCISSSNEPLTENLKIYPNPASDWLNVGITSPTSQALYFTLIDVFGINVFHKEISAGEEAVSFSVKQLPVGFYVWNLISERGQVLANGKVVISR